MEEVLDRPAVRRGCSMEKNAIGLYDLRVNDEKGRLIVDVKNIPFLRAVAILEESMNDNGGGREE